MIPVLFEIGPFKVYSYGLMLGVAFLLGTYIISLEFKRMRINPDLASTILILAVGFGITGAKILFLIENWSAFMRHPFDMAFSAGGLTWYGGFGLALLAVSLYVKAKKLPFLQVWDALGVALIIAYGVGRLGCHFSGDGDYGLPTDLPWGTNYENGTFPPSRAFESLPEVAAKFPGGVVPDNTPLHPTPVYEFILGVIGFVILWNLRKRDFAPGKVFMIYLMLASAFRFAVEFLRLNPRILGGLSEAQLIAMLVFVLGFAGFLIVNRGRESPQS